MSRTLLYYPSSEIPSEQWLKDSLLYWDKVGSIVPRRFQRVLDTPIMRYLSDEGLYRRFDPERILYYDNSSATFLNEFKQRLDSPDFAVELKKPDAEHY